MEREKIPWNSSEISSSFKHRNNPLDANKITELCTVAELHSDTGVVMLQSLVTKRTRVPFSAGARFPVRRHLQNSPRPTKIVICVITDNLRVNEQRLRAISPCPNTLPGSTFLRNVGNQLSDCTVS
jgi:hypothetical protein